jgi:hypothetical protein
MKSDVTRGGSVRRLVLLLLLIAAVTFWWESERCHEGHAAFIGSSRTDEKPAMPQVYLAYSSMANLPLLITPSERPADAIPPWFSEVEVTTLRHVQKHFKERNLHTFTERDAQGWRIHMEERDPLVQQVGFTHNEFISQASLTASSDKKKALEVIHLLRKLER